jgi:hypothetical protein
MVGEIYTLLYTITQIKTKDSDLLGRVIVSWGGGGRGGDWPLRHNVMSQKLCDVNKAAVETANVTQMLFNFN